MTTHTDEQNLSKADGNLLRDGTYGRDPNVAQFQQPMTTILLADDHHLVRKALRLLLESEAGFEIVGETSDGAETIELVQKKRPNVLVLDLSIPRVHGLDVIRQVTAHTQTKVVVVSMHKAESYVTEAFTNGASSYVMKNSVPAELVKAIRDVAAGRKYFLAEKGSHEIYGAAKSHQLSDGNSDPLHALTRREKIVLQLAAEGSNNTEIARQLSLSPRTIESHRASLMRKLKLRSQTDIVCFAVRKNIISV